VPLEPKFQRKRGGVALPRPFVDREEHIEAFWRTFHGPDLPRSKVLVYYGLGGIGKTRLRKELRDRLIDHDNRVLWAEVDFSLPSMRDPETALFSLRRRLDEDHGVAFPTFDLVYAYLWKLSRPNASPFEGGSPVFEAGSLAAELVSSFGIPLVTFVAKAAEMGSKPLKSWWMKRGRDDLKEVSGLDPPEIEERLPVYFAEDLAEHLEKRKLRAVLFFDTYEALVGDIRSEEQRLLRDDWFRELVLQLPSVLFVVFGREDITWPRLDSEWATVLEQRKIEELPERDARAILTAASLTDSSLQDFILGEAKNVPFYLDLALDTIEEMRRSGVNVDPQALSEREASAKVRLAEAFLRYLSPAEQTTVEVLAIPRFFDETLSRDLAGAFQTQLPLGQMREIFRFSFMSERSPGVFQMHDLMRECLEERLLRYDPAQLKAVHHFLFDRYDGKLENLEPKALSHEHEQAFLEAFHHAPEALGMAETVDWFGRRSSVFFDGSRWRLLLAACSDLAEEAESTLGPGQRGTWDALSQLAWVLSYQEGRNQEASALLHRAVSLCEEAKGDVTPHLTRLAHVLMFMGQMVKAEDLFRRSVLLLKEEPQRDTHVYCRALGGVAECCAARGLFDDAQNFYGQALGEATRSSSYADRAEIMTRLCSLYSSRGSYEKAEQLYQDAHASFVAQYGEDSFYMGVLQQNWGDLELRRGCYDQAELHTKIALETAERLNIVHPSWVACCYGNLGEAYLGQGRYAEAEDALQQCLSLNADETTCDLALTVWATELVGLVHLRQGDLATAERLLEQASRGYEDIDHSHLGGHPKEGLLAVGELRRRQGRYSEAEEALQEALEFVEQTLPEDHPEVGKILLELANIREELGRAGDAEQLRLRGRAIRQKAGCVN
jgi:tetratricopeptide (TPR) repeat protein